MSLLKVLPAVIAVGTVTALAVGVVTDFIMSDDMDIDEKSTTKEEIIIEMRSIQNELARLSDLKMLNDRRESSSQVKNIELNVDGVEINKLISTLETELEDLMVIYNRVD
jgi:hypothetical protein